MNNPYKSLDDHAFWKNGVENVDITFPDKIYNPTWKINDTDKIATMGSCFAQHIAKWLRENGFNVPFYIVNPCLAANCSNQVFIEKIQDVLFSSYSAAKPQPGLK
jgi:hypothetical protein